MSNCEALQLAVFRATAIQMRSGTLHKGSINYVTPKSLIFAHSPLLMKLLPLLMFSVALVAILATVYPHVHIPKPIDSPKES